MKTLSHQPAVIYLEAGTDFQLYSHGKVAVALGFGWTCSSIESMAMHNQSSDVRTRSFGLMATGCLHVYGEEQASLCPS